MNNSILLLISTLIGLSVFIFILFLCSLKEYKKYSLQSKLQRQLVNTKKEDFNILKSLNIYPKKLEKKLIKSGLKIKLEDLIVCFTIVIIVSLLIGTLTPMGISCLIIPLLAFILCSAFIDFKATKRIQSIDEQFIEAIRDMSDILKINNDLYNAIKETALNTAYPLKDELELICTKVDSNVDIIDALTEFADRTNSMAIISWVDKIVFASEKKANIADKCTEHSAKLKRRSRNNKNIISKLKSLKMLSVTLALMFSITLIILYSTSPEFSEVLEKTIGKILALITALSYIGTTYFIFKKIDKETTGI